MNLVDFIVSQGVPRGAALELAERKAKAPSLVSCEWRGKFVSLCPPSKDDGKKFDEMLKEGGLPFLNTDSVFMRDSANGRQFQESPDLGDKYKKACEKAGGSVKGKKYLHQLARFPGDPAAWVESRGDVRRACEANNMDCEGLVNVKGREVESPKKVDVAPRVIEQETLKLTANKRLSKREIADVREATHNRLKGKKR